MPEYSFNGAAEAHEAITKKSRRVLLRPIGRADYPKFFEWRADADNLHLWSSRRKIPTWEQFVAEFEADLHTTVTLLILRKRNRQPIGFLQAYNLNQADGWTYILEYLVPEARIAGSGAEALLLFGEYLFGYFPLRKLYAEVYEYNDYVLRGLVKAGFSEEGRSLRHVWHGDRYWDLVHLGYFREEWERLRPHIHRILAIEDDIDKVLNSRVEAGTLWHGAASE